MTYRDARDFGLTFNSAKNYYHLTAWASDYLGSIHGIKPEKIYIWAVRYRQDLFTELGLYTRPYMRVELISHIIDDKPFDCGHT